MKRLGMYTGKIYEQDDNIRTAECTVPLNDDNAEDKQYITDRYTLLHSSWCTNCTYCSLSREHNQKENKNK